MVVFLIFLGPLISFSLITMLLGNFFEKAGVEKRKALVPFVNVWYWFDITDRTPLWGLLFFVPYINVILIIWLITEFLKVYGKRNIPSQILGIFFGYIYLPILNAKDDFQYVGSKPPTKRSSAREWADALIFAVVAATIIRTFIIEAYTIPTTSMEKTLLAGDFLFVSKFHYGARVPMTPIAFPFAHHTMPVIKTKAYVDWSPIPYYRLPALQNVKRNDIVVFNWPAGDTVIVERQDRIYYNILRDFEEKFGKKAGRTLMYEGAQAAFGNDRQKISEAQIFIANNIFYDKEPGTRKNLTQQALNNGLDIVYRPVDKRENYIKRCVAIPGDTLKIIDRELFINSKPAYKPKHMQFGYTVISKERFPERILDKLDITDLTILNSQSPVYQIMQLTDETYQKVKNFKAVEKITVNEHDTSGGEDIFPNDKGYNWNIDNFGPIVIPKKGETVLLNLHTLPLYKRIIDVYEGNDLKVEDGKIYINGKEATSYTFKMNYYWLMGDNRHNSQDSRYWGFVPENHVVGKAWIIWLSLNPHKSFPSNIRWSRLFNIIHT